MEDILLGGHFCFAFVVVLAVVNLAVVVVIAVVVLFLVVHVDMSFPVLLAVLGALFIAVVVLHSLLVVECLVLSAFYRVIGFLHDCGDGWIGNACL